MPAFERARLLAVWPEGNAIVGDAGEKLGAELAATTLPQRALAPRVNGIERPFEAEPVDRDIVRQDGFEQESANEVVGDRIHPDLTFDGLRSIQRGQA